MSFAGVGPTELRILLAIGTVALFRDPHVDLGELGRLRLFDVGGVVATFGMLVALAVSVMRNATALAKMESCKSMEGRPRGRPYRFLATTLRSSTSIA